MPRKALSARGVSAETPSKIQGFFCDWLVFPSDFQRRGQSLWALLQLQEGSWDLPTWVTGARGTVRGLKLILPIVRAISVICLINPSSLRRLALPRGGSQAVAGTRLSERGDRRNSQEMRFEGGKGLQIHPVPPFSLDNFRSWKSLPMGHFQSVGGKTGGVPVAFFPLYPTSTEVSGRQDELPKG